MINLYPQTINYLYTSPMPSSVCFSRLKGQTYFISPSMEATQHLLWGVEKGGLAPNHTQHSKQE